MDLQFLSKTVLFRGSTPDNVQSMENPSVMEKAILGLQKAGFIILMDDFGSGYSSLNTLKNIPVDVLKIDMKFLSGEAAAAGRNECILASVIRMAGWLEIPVIMEGVETQNQVEFLKSIGCGYVQGYYFAKPMGRRLACSSWRRRSRSWGVQLTRIWARRTASADR